MSTNEISTDDISTITVGLQNLNMGHNFEEVSTLPPLIEGILNGTATVDDVSEDNVNVVFSGDGMIPLMYAVMLDETALAQKIAQTSRQSLTYRNTLNGKTALMYAIEQNFFDMVEMLLVEATSSALMNMVNIANDREFGKTPLMYTLTLDNEACVNMIGLLVTYGADASAQNQQHRTLYEEAVYIGDKNQNTLSYINSIVYPDPMNPQGS